METDLIVAPVEDLEAVWETMTPDRTWPWTEAPGLTTMDLATLQCLIEGIDPREPVTPRETLVNPFTKAEIVVTHGIRKHRAMEAGPSRSSEDDPASLLCVPTPLVEALADMDAGAKADLARRWAAIRWSASKLDDEAEFTANLFERLVAMATMAVQQKEALFIYICP